MEKYNVLVVDHSIVQPDDLDVELENNNHHFAKCLRVSNKLKNVTPGAECIMHDNMLGIPVAYCFGDEMHIVSVPETWYDAFRSILDIPGVTRFSLNRFRFYMALRAALKNRNVQPTLSGVANMLLMAEIQKNDLAR